MTSLIHLRRLDQPHADRLDDRLHLVGRAELGEDVVDVERDGALGDVELFADLAGGAAFAGPAQHLAFALGERDARGRRQLRHEEPAHQRMREIGEPVGLQRQAVDLGRREAVRAPRDGQQSEHAARGPARLRDADRHAEVARVAPERRLLRRIGVGPDDHVRARRPVAHGRIDLDVVARLIVRHPARRIGVEDLDQGLRSRLRHADSIAAVLEAETLRVCGNLVKELLLVFRRIELVVGILPA